MKGLQLSIFAAIAFASVSEAADWPTYRADAARSGYTSEELPKGLQLRWGFTSPHRPSPAWPTRSRLGFDRAYQPIVANGGLYFGSSADDRVYALDASTGVVRWTFVCDAPVRFAPLAWRDRVFVASDDGYLYCLSADDGEMLWKRRGGPGSDMLLGNDRMISRWPARGGPVVLDDIVYFGAGIWPTEGIFLYALDPNTGEVLWKNDTSGAIEMDQPHSTARAKSGISLQGYLAAVAGRLIVPTGRAVPAILDRDDGTLRLFPLQAHQQRGGSDVMAIDRYFANGGFIYDRDTGAQIGEIGLQAAVHPEFLVYADDYSVRGLVRRDLAIQREVADRRGNAQQVTRLRTPDWHVDVEYDAGPQAQLPEDLRPPEVRMPSTAWTTPAQQGGAKALIVAADQVIVGGAGRVTIVDINTRQLTWSADVDGAACGLAVAGGCLYVSTDRGRIYCFGVGGPKQPELISEVSSQTTIASAERFARAADEIVTRYEPSDGVCIDLACGDGGLIFELVRRTKLQIYAIDRDAAKVERLRDRLNQAGLYGTRVTVHHAEPEQAPYVDYCADLVVSSRAVLGNWDDNLSTVASRLRRPCGGMFCIGPAGQMEVSTRGELPGAGSWTHQNMSPANSLCSDDRRVRGTLEMLWYRDTDFLMANRHGRAPTALVQSGRMFVEGLHGLRAQSVYNGRVLWEFSRPNVLRAYNREHSIGAAWTGGNICLGPNRVFLHDGGVCFVLDASSGKEVARWEPPSRPDGKPGVWGYLAYHNGLLFGSLAKEDYVVKCWSDRWDTGDQFTESIELFALDATTGRVVWQFRPKHSIRHNAIAMGGGRVYLIDRPVALGDDLNYSAALGSAEERRGVAGDAADSEPAEPPSHEFGRLVALEERTGKLVWEDSAEIFGTLLVYATEDDLLWMGYQAAHQASRDSERADRMAVFAAADGERRWDIQTEYADRPVLNGRTIYAPPGAWDLLTGRKLPFELDRSYGCGIVAGCREMLLFRSATLGYVDLSTSPETQNYGGIRPGCWIAAIPAGGVVAMPDAASWCTCSYLNQGTLVLRPVADGQQEASESR